MSAHDRRSPLKRATGLGSAGTGVTHWWRQRLTAVALVPLLVWFVASLIAHASLGYDAARIWRGQLWVAVPMVLLLIALFVHMALGLQVVIEDYVHHDRIKLAAVAAVSIACFALAVTGVLAALMLTLGR